MVRIAYRTSSGIYGPKDSTFPRAVPVDVETQLKRGRIREHSLKKCISVLLIVVAFCMCGLIIGLLSTCEDLEEEIKDDSDVKPITVDIQKTRRESVDIETTKVFTVTSSTLDVTTPPAPTELSDATTLQETEDATGTSTYGTTADLEISENINETVAEEDSNQSENYTAIPSSVSLVQEYNEITAIETLANVRENVPTCHPPHIVPKISPSVRKPEPPVALGDLRNQSEPVRPTQETTTANDVQLKLEAQNGAPYRPVVHSITTPIPVQSAPIVKVSFVTTPPAIDFNKK